MPAYIAPARRALFLAAIALLAACSSKESTAPSKTPDQDPPTDTSTTPPPAPSVDRIELSGDDEIVVTYNGRLQAQAKTAAGQPIEAGITWSSSDVSIASVDAGGNLMAHRAGTVRITASA